jgi:RecA-family ATPase
LLQEEPESVTWLWFETLPTAGMSLLTAKPKVGKTTFALNLALAVARGEPSMGRSTTKGRVLYLALGEKRSEVQRRFVKLGATNEDIYIHTVPAPEATMEALEAAINELRPSLVVIDPLLKLVRLKDANDYAEVNRALEPVLTLARISGAHIMALHHMGKFVRDDGDDILGSTAFY